MFEYDIIVVGAGHAGCEAAAAAANLGSKTLLVTLDMNKIANMSCNPSIGGVAKGQIIKEIDALGGYSGVVTDYSMLQFRMLNMSKGPAMWSPRAQCDRVEFSIKWRDILESIDNLDIFQDNVSGLLIKDNVVVGVKTLIGLEFRAKGVILTNGTFLNGLMHIGDKQMEGGRAAEMNSGDITSNLKEYGFKTGRMKTGTPARLDARSIDFSKLQRQDGDDTVVPFSYMTDEPYKISQLPCYIARTNPEVHKIINNSLDRSPLYDGTIQSIGPRYCPSIETKLVTFADKDSHQLFLEPEGRTTIEYYINGFSSSLPWEVQYEALRKVEGLENVKLFRPGYAIEYDFFDPTQLHYTLETKIIKNLFFAGQINGTTGYEEAAGQGLIAGINAHNKCEDKPEFVLKRDEAYIGVLIDDLVNKGVNEPYRMFTSRAEYRILLRQDNADERLTKMGHEIGLVTDERIEKLIKKKDNVNNVIDFIDRYSISPERVNPYLKGKGTSELKQKNKLRTLLVRPQLNFQDILQIAPKIEGLLESSDNFRKQVETAVEIHFKYSGYIEREKLQADKFRRLEYVTLPTDIDYNSLKSLSMEAREKLTKTKPQNIGQASRIDGVSPADISVLLIYLGR